VHRGSLPLVHVDAYRLREAGARLDLDDLDLDAALEDAVTVVEWGEGLAERLTASWLHVELGRGTGTAADRDEGRTARVRAHGPRWVVVQAH
jgi:tRNA threonylcarbamoyladenosine biosynthesis protein TsaE